MKRNRSEKDGKKELKYDKRSLRYDGFIAAT